MKLIIAGSRTINLTTDELAEIMDRWQLFHEVTEIISGGAMGIDSTASRLAQEESIPFTLCSAPWTTQGRSAGPIRNAKMASMGDALLLIWDGKSKGSNNMKKCMEKLNKRIMEVIK
jgi:hypothetical protein